MHRTDRWMLIACAVIFGVWALNTALSSILFLYLGVLGFAAILTYLILKADPQNTVRDAALIGGVGCVVYAYIDSLMSNMRFGMITHLKGLDLSPFGETPLALVLTWGCLITAMLYAHRRLRPLWYSFYPSMVILALIALVGGVAFEWLGNQARLWNWNVSVVSSGYVLGVPIFAPISYALASLFASYFLKNAFIGGLRCGLVLGVMRFGLFALLRYLNTGV